MHLQDHILLSDTSPYCPTSVVTAQPIAHTRKSVQSTAVNRFRRRKYVLISALNSGVNAKEPFIAFLLFLTLRGDIRANLESGFHRSLSKIVLMTKALQIATSCPTTMVFLISISQQMSDLFSSVKTKCCGSYQIKGPRMI
jgi:hypothetical protein